MKYVWLALAFITGWAFAMYNHPYEKCVRKGFTDPVDIGECIWLLGGDKL